MKRRVKPTSCYRMEPGNDLRRKGYIAVFVLFFFSFFVLLCANKLVHKTRSKPLPCKIATASVTLTLYIKCYFPILHTIEL